MKMREWNVEERMEEGCASIDNEVMSEFNEGCRDGVG